MSDKIIVFGSSGHARSIAVILEQLNYEIVGFIDSYLPKGINVLRYKTLGDESALINCGKTLGTINIVIGVGDNSNRQKVVEMISQINPFIKFPVIVSPNATITSYTSIARGTVIFSNSFVNVESSIGEFCIINSSSIIEHHTIIGNYCNISPSANIGGDVRIEDFVFIGSSATVIQKRVIGCNSVIGAGAVVIENIPNDVLAVGIPARIKKYNYINKQIFK